MDHGGFAWGRGVITGRPDGGRGPTVFRLEINGRICSWNLRLNARFAPKVPDATHPEPKKRRSSRSVRCEVRPRVWCKNV
jgi:hypothetical protein